MDTKRYLWVIFLVWAATWFTIGAIFQAHMDDLEHWSRFQRLESQAYLGDLQEGAQK